MKKKLAAILLPLLLLMTVFAPAVYAVADPPANAQPAYYYGTVSINGTWAPIGTVIEAVGTGVVNDGRNPITTTLEGQYGASTTRYFEAANRLFVQGTITDGTIVSFMVGGQLANEVAVFHAGDRFQINLTVGTATPPVGIPPGSTLDVGNTPAPTGPGLGGGVGVPGGGGGGGSGSLVQISGLAPSTPLFLDGAGRVLNPVTLTSPTGQFQFNVPQGTRMLDANGLPVSNFSALALDPTVLPQPPRSRLILSYDFGPNGSTFQPPITLTMTYDPALIPAGQRIRGIAYFDTVTNQWINLQGVIDPVNHTITVTVSHFTRFAVVTEEEFSDFVVSDMTMGSTTAIVGEKVSIGATVGNYGNVAAKQTYSLMVDGKAMIDQEVTLEPGETATLSFSVAMGSPGTYDIQIGDLTSTLIVEPEPTTTPTQSPTTTPTVAPTQTTSAPTSTATAQPTQTTAPTASATSSPTVPATSSVAPTTPAASSGQNLTWIWILAAGVGVILVIGFITIVIRRRSS